MTFKKAKIVLASTLAVAALSFTTAAMAENKLIVKDAAGTTDKVVLTDTGYIGLGTNAPTSPLHVVANPIGNVGGITNVIKIEGNATTNAAGFAAYRNTGAFQTAGSRLGFIFFGDNYLRVNHPVGFFANAEETWTSTSTPANFDFMTTPAGSTTRQNRMRITAAGNIGVGTTTPTSKLQVVGLPVYADNTAALAGGLTAGAFYRTSTGQLMVAF